MSPTPVTAPLAPGQILLGRYRLVRPLNEGGMSVVWAGTHEFTGKAVALKLLKADSAGDESVRRRMLREARAACAVIHPNVLQIHAVLELEDGSPVLVMDLLEGELLRDRLLRRPVLSLDETATLLLPVISGAGTAHAAGIIHRDLKPENIFLAQEGGTLCVKVLDFGIAKLVSPDPVMSASNALTNAGMMLGTPYYMAPEQVVGEGVDHRSDIWSLGIILYECLAGVRPTEADNIGKTLRRVITHDIEPLSARVPALPRDILDLVDRMLAQEPKDRPASLREVGEVLAPYAVGVTLGTFGPPTIAPPSADITGERRALTGPIPNPPGYRSDAPPADGLTTKRAAADYVETLLARSPDSVRGQSEPLKEKPGPIAGEPAASAARLGLWQKLSRLPRWLILLAATALFAALGAAGYLTYARVWGGPPLATATAQSAPVVPVGLCPPGMASIPAGAFRMGSSDGKAEEQPIHDITVAAYCLDLSEVTVQAYEDCVRRGACRPAEITVNWQDVTPDVRQRESAACTAKSAAGAGLSLNCVSWDAALAYCRSVDKRLPSEPEWEYAAAGGDEQRRFPWGVSPPQPKLLNACDSTCAAALERQGGSKQPPIHDGDDGYPGIAPPGRFPMGDARWGVHDMAGNVWEWTSSPYCAYPSHACESQYRVFRGGGWGGRYVDNVRVSARKWSHPSHRYNDVGFRCAKDLL